jgi:heme-degrading monooxygenase HmoA
VIARIWHGWTKPENADGYERLLKSTILPSIHRVKGYQGAHLLRRDAGSEIEFITITMWDSMEAVREFAGPDRAHAVVPAEAQKLLARFDDASVHYEAKLDPVEIGNRMIEQWTLGSNCLVQRMLLLRREAARLAFRQVPELKRADGHPHQPQHLDAESVHHPADVAVLPFFQHDFQPGILLACSKYFRANAA